MRTLLWSSPIHLYFKERAPFLLPCISTVSGAAGRPNIGFIFCKWKPRQSQIVWIWRCSRNLFINFQYPKLANFSCKQIILCSSTLLFSMFWIHAKNSFSDWVQANIQVLQTIFDSDPDLSLWYPVSLITLPQLSTI